MKKDRYGYIGIETLLNYCQNSKDHSITPNDFMRMNRVRIEEPKQGEWVLDKEFSFVFNMYECSKCRFNGSKRWHFCPNCGSDNRPKILDEAVDGEGKDGNVKEGEAEC